MMDDRPNVQVIYTQAASKGPGLLAILAELIVFVLFLVMAGVVAAFMGAM